MRRKEITSLRLAQTIVALRKLPEKPKSRRGDEDEDRYESSLFDE